MSTVLMNQSQGLSTDQMTSSQGTSSDPSTSSRAHLLGSTGPSSLELRVDSDVGRGVIRAGSFQGMQYSSLSDVLDEQLPNTPSSDNRELLNAIATISPQEVSVIRTTGIAQRPPSYDDLNHGARLGDDLPGPSRGPRDQLSIEMGSLPEPIQSLGEPSACSAAVDEGLIAPNPQLSLVPPTLPMPMSSRSPLGRGATVEDHSSRSIKSTDGGEMDPGAGLSIGPGTSSSAPMDLGGLLSVGSTRPVDRYV